MVIAPAPRTISRRVRFAPLLASVALLAATPAQANQQRDPELGAILRTAIDSTRCDEHADRFGEEVFFKLQEPRLRPIISSAQLRVDILKQVYCESNAVVRRYRLAHKFDLHLTPELVLAVIDVESRFDRYAVSSAGAVGLMQVMPFWPRQLGLQNRLFGNVEFNVKLGCEILAYYMHGERNDYRRALARYNGSVGRNQYPDLVLARLANRWRA